MSTTTVTAVDLALAIDTREPRYSFFRYEHEYAGEALTPIVFIYTCPTLSKIKERMLYASSRAGVLAMAVETAGLTIAKKVCGIESSMGLFLLAMGLHR